MITPVRKTRRRPTFRKKKDDFDSKLLDLARVVRMTAGGRRLRFRAVIIVGDRKGRVGLGVSKGADVAQAIEKATTMAKKNVIKIIITEGTIPHEIGAKFGAARVLLKPQKKGRGLIAGGTIRVICGLAGIKSISAKILSKTKNKLNNARATIKALKKLKAPRSRVKTTANQENNYATTSDSAKN